MIRYLESTEWAADRRWAPVREALKSYEDGEIKNALNRLEKAGRVAKTVATEYDSVANKYAFGGMVACRRERATWELV